MINFPWQEIKEAFQLFDADESGKFAFHCKQFFATTILKKKPKQLVTKLLFVLGDIDVDELFIAVNKMKKKKKNLFF